MRDQAANQAEEMAIQIAKVIYMANTELMQYSPDALIRVFVHLAIKNNWSQEKTQEEVKKGIKYYYENHINRN